MGPIEMSMVPASRFSAPRPLTAARSAISRYSTSLVRVTVWLSITGEQGLGPAKGQPGRTLKPRLGPLPPVSKVRRDGSVAGPRRVQPVGGNCSKSPLTTRSWPGASVAAVVVAARIVASVRVTARLRAEAVGIMELGGQGPGLG